MIDKHLGVPLLDADMRLILAIRAFFAILFSFTIPEDIAQRMLPPGPPQPTPSPEDAEKIKTLQAELEAARAEARAAQTAVKSDSGKRDGEKREAPKGPAPEAVAVRALSILQSEGRLVDFLFEEIDGYGDADVGAAVREIHRNCRRALTDHFKLTPVRAEAEESMVTVPEGYDPAEIRLVGNVVGKPPFSGTLKHKGWRAEVVRLPSIPEGTGAKVIAPAEVEV